MLYCNLIIEDQLIKLATKLIFTTSHNHTLSFATGSHVSGFLSLYVINAPHLVGVNWFGATHAPEVTGSCAKTGFFWRGVVTAGARGHRNTSHHKAFVPMLGSLQSLSRVNGSDTK